jgi:hypothetical protein
MDYSDLAKRVQELSLSNDETVDLFKIMIKDTITDIITLAYGVDDVGSIARLHQLIDVNMLDMTHRELNDIIFSNGTEEQQIRVHDIMIEAD